MKMNEKKKIFVDAEPEMGYCPLSIGQGAQAGAGRAGAGSRRAGHGRLGSLGAA